MSSASLHHRVPSLYLLKIEHGSPSRAYLRGFRKLEEKTVLLLLVLLPEHGLDTQETTFLLSNHCKKLTSSSSSSSASLAYVLCFDSFASMEQIKEIKDLIAANGGHLPSK
ncbi:hypothetical protein OIU84_000727 [Salix udensis]|uniref:Uncharacterized protein n=1 Tax=Salix udensis TaxID=889485 RepID=A0AAD6PME0_9ROSI|nr:hypothetical protein OIU84_000727 [Salix udensis]